MLKGMHKMEYFLVFFTICFIPKRTLVVSGIVLLTQLGNHFKLQVLKVPWLRGNKRDPPALLCAQSSLIIWNLNEGREMVRLSCLAHRSCPDGISWQFWCTKGEIQPLSSFQHTLMMYLEFKRSRKLSHCQLGGPVFHSTMAYTPEEAPFYIFGISFWGIFFLTRHSVMEWKLLWFVFHLSHSTGSQTDDNTFQLNVFGGTWQFMIWSYTTQQMFKKCCFPNTLL